MGIRACCWPKGCPSLGLVLGPALPSLWSALSHCIHQLPYIETHLPPISQLRLHQTVQGERDNVVQVLNLEEAETPTPSVGDHLSSPKGLKVQRSTKKQKRAMGYRKLRQRWEGRKGI